MNAITKTDGQRAVAQISDEDLIRTLASSLYPGAKPESVALVLGYCRAANLDPMLKPVHIVPMSVKTKSKNGNADVYEMRDVIMPGITQYRIAASRSGKYVGKSEPVFGPTVEAKFGSGDKATTLKYPEFCTITVRKLVGNTVCDFVSTEYWLENFAESGRGSGIPNAMWKKRAFGQLAKCAEAQALRMAFPELIGGQETAEEMIGKTIEHEEPEIVAPAKAGERAGAALDKFAGQAAGAKDITPPKPAAEAKGEMVAKPATMAAGKPAAQAEAPDAAECDYDPETGEVHERIEASVPDMPPSAWAEFTENGKWMAAWKWLSMTVGAQEDQPLRQATVDRYASVLAKVSGYSAKYRTAVDEFIEAAGVKINVGPPGS